jgi:hypothetical protein
MDAIMKVAFIMRTPILALFALPLLACSSSSGASSTPTSMEIVTVSGAPLTAVAGDALALKVVETLSDGSKQDLPAAAEVAWSGPTTVTATSPDGTPADNAYPATGASPTALWIANPGRPDRAANLSGVLFVLDSGSTPGGSVMVTATVTGASTGSASAAIPVAASPAGDAARGAALYGKSGANCAECHGATGQGSVANADGTTYALAGMNYSFPAPPIDAEPDNAAAEWSPALFAIASRADLDDEAVTLRLPMPDWIGTPNPSTGKTLTTQDFADIFAFLATQTAAP